MASEVWADSLQEKKFANPLYKGAYLFVLEQLNHF